MRLCPVRDLEEGMVLGKSIYQNGSQLLLGAGFRITADIKDRLLEKGYTHVFIAEEGTEDVIPEDIISDELRHKAQTRVSDNISKVRDTLKFQDMTRSKAMDLLERGGLKNINISYGLRQVVDEILSEIAAVGSDYYNSFMIKSKDSFAFDHALNTTVLAIIIGRKYRYNKAELKSLALGTFLHDIGKVITEQLEESGGSEGVDLYREHPTFGYLLVKSDRAVSPSEAQIINQHHEHQDGSGFPIGLTGTNEPPVKTDNHSNRGKIFRFAEITAVVNAYDNFCLNPVLEKCLSPGEVIKKIIENAGTLYNRDIVQTLTKVIAIYPIGSYVKVINIIDPSLVGSYGVVAKINRQDLSRPVIIITTNKYRKKIRPIMLDTSKLKLIQLELVI